MLGYVWNRVAYYLYTNIKVNRTCRLHRGVARHIRAPTHPPLNRSSHLAPSHLTPRTTHPLLKLRPSWAAKLPPSRSSPSRGSTPPPVIPASITRGEAVPDSQPGSLPEYYTSPIIPPPAFTPVRLTAELESITESSTASTASPVPTEPLKKAKGRVAYK